MAEQNDPIAAAVVTLSL